MVEKTKTKCPKCDKVEVVMTWRPTMVGTLALIDECESCHFRPEPRSEAWGYNGGPVPVHYGDPPHDGKLGLGSFTIKCTVCKTVCIFHDTYWECPKCSKRITTEQVMDVVDKQTKNMD